MRRAIAMLLTFVLVLAACSSGDDDGTTTTIEVGSTTTVLDGTDGSDDAVNGGDEELAVDAMCRTLALFSAARVPPPSAAESMMFVDLADATSEEMAAYGDLLIGAPALQCPQHQRYAEAIQYWLGF